MTGPSNHKKAKPFNITYILHNVECFRSKISRAHHCGQILMDQSYRHHFKKANQTLSFLIRGGGQGRGYGNKGAGSGCIWGGERGKRG